MRTVLACLLVGGILSPQDLPVRSAPGQKGWRKATAVELGKAESTTGADFKIEIALVRVDAEVYSAAGIVSGLTAGDFRVSDNGVVREITALSQDKVPLDLILLFDISGSMREGVEKVARGARQALDELKTGDRVAVMTFNSRSRVVLPFSEDFNQVETAIERDVLGEDFSGATLIQSAVHDATRIFGHRGRDGGDRRRALIVITDNEGQRTQREETLLTRLWEGDVMLCGLLVNSFSRAQRTVIGILNPSTSAINLAMRAGIEGLADKTGGEVVKVENSSAFRDLIARIRQRYSLYYKMPEGQPGERREVRLDLTAQATQRTPGARVRSRKGYLMPAGTTMATAR